MVNNEANSIQSADCVIFMNRDLGIGGIETYIYRSIKLLLKRGIRVIWVCDKYMYVDDSFKDVVNQDKILIIKQNLDAGRIKSYLADIDRPVINIICHLFGEYLKAEEFKEKNEWARVNTFYFLNHYVGRSLFCEDAFILPIIRKNVVSTLRKVYCYMIGNNSFRGYSSKHIDEVNRRYGLDLVNNALLYAPPLSTSDRFERENCISKYKRNEFIIIAVSRLDFPHKGFILGLVDVFAQMKERYPQLSLVIVGDGAGMDQLVQKVNRLNTSARNAIRIVGSVPADKLEQYFKDANLNISAAACCREGAAAGTISITVRNYSLDCQVYGFLPEKDNMITETIPGQSCQEYIEKVLAMNQEEYVDKCEEGYHFYNSQSNTAPSIEQIRNNDPERVMDTKLRKELKLIFAYSRIKVKASYYEKVAKNVISKSIYSHYQ